MFIKEENLEAYEVDLKNEKLNKIISHSLKYHADKAIFYKAMFYVLSILAILFNSSIPICIQLFNDSKVLVTIISSLSAISSSLLILLCAKDSWYSYRKHLESLKTECTKYIASVLEYSNISEEDKIMQFICNYEKLNLNEKSLWGKKHDKRGISSVKKL